MRQKNILNRTAGSAGANLIPPICDLLLLAMLLLTACTF
jgi:hypothetical protein